MAYDDNKKIRIGATANDKTGDSLREAFRKTNANFEELYTTLGLLDDTTLSLGAFEFSGSTMTTTDSTAIVIDQATTVTSNLTVGGDLLPQSAYGGDLGSSSLPWRSLYVSNNTIYIGGVAVSLDSQNNLTVAGTPVNAAGSAAWASITGKPTFATVATSGSYADLSNKPSIPADIADLTDTGNLLSGSTSSLANGANTVSLGSDGTLTLPGTGTIRTAFGAMSINAPTGSSNLSIKSSDATTYMIVGNGSAGVTVGAHNWQFSNTGNLTFPDATVQTTAYTGPQTTLDGDVTGSVFGDDSSVIVNAIDNSLHASNIYINGNGYIRGSADQTLNIQTSYDTSIPGQTISAIDAQNGPTNNWITIIISGSGTNYPEIVAVQPGWTVTGTGLTNEPVTQVEQVDLGGGVVIYKIYTAISSTKAGYTYTFTAPSTTVNTTKTWAFSDRGDLTIPGDIKSQGNINIDINLADSTLHRWQFGEDGVLNVPSDIVRNGSPGLTLGASHNVYIVGDRGDNNRTWTFDGTSGDTILPNGTVIADDGNDGIEVIMPTTVGQANTFKWRFTDQAVGTSTLSLQAGTLDTNLDDWYFGFNSTKYIGLHGTGQYISWFNGADLGGRLIFGEASGNNTGDVNAIELKATDGDVYVTSTESVKITVDANDSSARVWTFDPTGTLTAPGDIIATGNVGEFGTVNANYLGHITGQTQIQIGDGNLANGQTIVITDQRVRILAAVPATSIGSSGDYVGSVAFNSTYIYYCTANYDGVTNIWKRLAWSGDTW